MVLNKSEEATQAFCRQDNWEAVLIKLPMLAMQMPSQRRTEKRLPEINLFPVLPCHYVQASLQLSFAFAVVYWMIFPSSSYLVEEFQNCNTRDYLVITEQNAFQLSINRKLTKTWILHNGLAVTFLTKTGSTCTSWDFILDGGMEAKGMLLCPLILWASSMEVRNVQLESEFCGKTIALKGESKLYKMMVLSPHPSLRFDCSVVY